MQVNKKELEKSQIELTVELSVQEFEPYIKQGGKKVSEEVKIDGFRTGRVPMNILKQKVGEMTILEEAARIAINKTVESVIKDNAGGQPIGQPQIDIIKLAPDNPMQYKITLTLLPEIVLGDYKNVNVKARKVEIAEEELKRTIESIRERGVKEVIVGRSVQESDKVLIDIEMFLDKVPIEGGQNKGTAVIINKDYIVPGFDRKLIGAKKNDTREFSLPYPKDYHMKNLAGKIVEFKVKVKEIYERQLPDLDDNLAKKLGFKKLDEMKSNVRKNIFEQKKKENEQAIEKEILEKIISRTKFGNIPEILIGHESETMLVELEQNLSSHGLKFDDYLSSIQKTRDQLTLDLLPEAVRRVKASLLIRQVAKQENIKIGVQEIENHIKEMKKHYKDDKDALRKVSDSEYKSYVFNVLTSQEVINKLKKWNINN